MTGLGHPRGLRVLFLTELCPMRLRRPIGIAIELLAGIPSIIYGIWGLFVFAPFLQQHVQPFLIDLFGAQRQETHTRAETLVTADLTPVSLRATLEQMSGGVEVAGSMGGPDGRTWTVDVDRGGVSTTKVSSREREGS